VKFIQDVIQGCRALRREDLINHVKKLLQNETLTKEINKRMREFEEKRKSSWRDLFNELCFCILTANSSAQMGIKVQNSLGFEGFYYLPEEELSSRLTNLGYRYPRVRAKYIVRARKYAKDLERIVKETDVDKARGWLVKNIKGIGLKEASHFLRNVGFKEIAIIDRHILKILHEYGLIDEIPRSLTKRKYLEIEKILKDIAKELNLSPAELDLYLWFSKTGKVLK